MGHPNGTSELVAPATYYDAVFGADEERVNWRWHGAKVVTWYPALAFAEGRIYDIGCGPGHFAEMCRDFGRPYVGGVDFSEKAVVQAREAVPGVHFVHADLRTFALPSADTYVALEVLEHVYEDLDILRRIPAGKCVVGSVPSFHTEGHCRWFTKRQEVENRYSQVVNIQHIVTETVGANTWFIWKGKRR